MYAPCEFGTVNMQGFVWKFFMHDIYNNIFIHLFNLSS